MTEPNRAARGMSRTTVVADDGVSLAVTIDGPSDAHLTAVCLHGHCQDAESWVATCDLVDLPDVRIVRYDQRGHGSSGMGDAMSFTLDRLSSDLDAVLRAVAPSGPVVLVGYSMGGMVALAHARRYPESIGDRVVGVALLATAASGLADGGVGRYLRHPATSMLHRAVLRAPRAMGISKRAGGRVCSVVGRRRADDSWLRVAAMVLSNDTSVVTWSRLLAEFANLDESAALATLARIPVLIGAGTADRFVPIAHSESMAAALPHARLVRFVDAGHRVLSECPGEVAGALGGLLDLVASGEGRLRRLVV